MRNKQIRVTQVGWGGLKYVEVHGIPAKKILGYGDAIHADDLKVMERRIAEEVLLQHRPISGLEVAYLRQVFGISRRAFAKEIGLSDVAVLKWERAKRKRLVTTSEIAVRVFFAKKLGLSLSHVTTPLIPTGKLTAKLMVEFDPANQAAAA